MSYVTEAHARLLAAPECEVRSGDELGSVVVFDDFDDAFGFFFGSEALARHKQHDAHVKRRASHLRHQAWKTEYEANCARFREEAEEAGGICALLGIRR